MASNYMQPEDVAQALLPYYPGATIGADLYDLVRSDAGTDPSEWVSAADYGIKYNVGLKKYTFDYQDGSVLSVELDSFIRQMNYVFNPQAFVAILGSTSGGRLIKLKQLFYEKDRAHDLQLGINTTILTGVQERDILTTPIRIDASAETIVLGVEENVTLPDPVGTNRIDYLGQDTLENAWVLLHPSVVIERIGEVPIWYSNAALLTAIKSSADAPQQYWDVIIDQYVVYGDHHATERSIREIPKGGVLVVSIPDMQLLSSSDGTGEIAIGAGTCFREKLPEQAETSITIESKTVGNLSVYPIPGSIQEDDRNLYQIREPLRHIHQLGRKDELLQIFKKVKPIKDRVIYQGDEVFEVDTNLNAFPNDVIGVFTKDAPEPQVSPEFEDLMSYFISNAELSVLDMLSQTPVKVIGTLNGKKVLYTPFDAIFEDMTLMNLVWHIVPIGDMLLEQNGNVFIGANLATLTKNQNQMLLGYGLPLASVALKHSLEKPSADLYFVVQSDGVKLENYLTLKEPWSTFGQIIASQMSVEQFGQLREETEIVVSGGYAQIGEPLEAFTSNITMNGDVLVWSINPGSVVDELSSLAISVPTVEQILNALS